MTSIKTFAEYQPLAMRTAKPMDYNAAVLHAAMGMGSEPAELASTIASYMGGEGMLDVANLIEETGDIIWFAALLADTEGLQLETLHNPDYLVVEFSATEKLKGLPVRFVVGVAAMRLIARIEPIMTMYKAHAFYGKPRSLESLKEMLAKFLAAWMNFIEVVRFDLDKEVTYDRVLGQNIAKLAKRYPDKYSDAAAIARADKVEEITIKAVEQAREGVVISSSDVGSLEAVLGGAGLGIAGVQTVDGGLQMHSISLVADPVDPACRMIKKEDTAELHSLVDSANKPATWPWPANVSAPHSQVVAEEAADERAANAPQPE